MPEEAPVRVGAPRRRSPTTLVATGMPVAGPLVDTFGRVHTDLRLSITDRCNLRCVYCMPEEGVPYVPRKDILTFEEIVRVARVAYALGVRSLRMTGGEPLVRRGVVELVQALAEVGFDDLSMTTNGTELGRLAPALAGAGLRRVNISCDSLRPDRFARIRRRGDLATVLRSMSAAEAAGLAPLKVNVVLLAGENEDEVLDFAAFARDTGRIVRFIEYMPLDGAGDWRRDDVVAGREILARISARWPLRPVPVPPGDPAPATRFEFVDGRGEIGVISSVSEPFCGSCNRLRLTADGAIRNCLFSLHELSVRDTMRAGGTDDDIAMVLRRSVWGKLAGHGINDPQFLRPARSMSMIGG
jgi:cyclic pyranopterin phosphate synthase